MSNRALSDELTKVAYDGLTALQAAQALLTATITRPRGVIHSREVIRAIVFDDLVTLTADQRDLLQLMVSTGEVNADDPEVVNAFATLFQGKNTTLQALNALRTKTVSLAEDLGFGRYSEEELTAIIRKVTARI